MIEQTVEGDEIIMTNDIGNMEKKYISLKEAARISGYSSDYVGQLIRQGKLGGKQVHCNVAWMTTEKEVKEYLKKNNGKNGKGIDVVAEWRERGLKMLPMALSMFLYGTVAALGVLGLFLFYIIATSIEYRLEERALANVEMGAATIKPYAQPKK